MLDGGGSSFHEEIVVYNLCHLSERECANLCVIYRINLDIRRPHFCNKV